MNQEKTRKKTYYDLNLLLPIIYNLFDITGNDENYYPASLIYEYINDDYFKLNETKVTTIHISKTLGTINGINKKSRGSNLVYTGLKFKINN